MTEIASDIRADFKPFDFLDQWYEQSTAAYGVPIGFRLLMWSSVGEWILVGWSNKSSLLV
jgi:hypothetical protein